MKFLFGDIVVVNQKEIGVIVKTWENKNGYEYEVYNRIEERIVFYKQEEIERYKVRHKYLNDEELNYQNNR